MTMLKAFSGTKALSRTPSRPSDAVMMMPP
jgi:hypothetical protein